MKTETIIRTVVLAVALINQILAICGKDTIPLYESDIAQIVTLAVTIGSTLWAWWKNNSFTHNAIKADDYKKHLDEFEEMEHK
jgi:SPP1 family holin